MAWPNPRRRRARFSIASPGSKSSSWPTRLRDEVRPCGRRIPVFLNESVRFSIITPSFRNSTWLKLCIASVADQGVELEHIIQDAGSDDGTLDWLPHDPRVKAFVEK